MSYFSKFPFLSYTFDSNTTYNIVTDVLKRVTVNQKTQENLTIFDEYDVKDGETPEIVSFKFYDTPDYHWVILVTNNIFDARFGWPLSGEQLFKFVQDKYGEANVGVTHHYTQNESSDIIVDPTQLTIVYTRVGSEKVTSNVLSFPNAYPISNLSYEETKNESKRRIRVLKAEFLNAFVAEFEKLINV